MHNVNIAFISKDALSHRLLCKAPNCLLNGAYVFRNTRNNYRILSFKQNTFTTTLCPWVKTYQSLGQTTTKDGDVLVKKPKVPPGPDLSYFMHNKNVISARTKEIVPYVQGASGMNQKVYIDVYGCQMNVSDTAVVWSILKEEGYQLTSSYKEADVILIMTCAIREGAEDKVFTALSELAVHKRRRKMLDSPELKIAVLGCMASRLKKKILLKHNCVDIIVGPDGYKDLPRLLAKTDKETAINVALSLDETYADVRPVHLNPDAVTAFVSIMRGCDNMCTYCIVPFTRGRERSRPITSILTEIQWLSDLGVKEVTLLGQNVNSYRDTSTSQFLSTCSSVSSDTKLAKGFKTVYKSRKGGLRFHDLLEKVSEVNPEMRIRFTSPHPKDFPDEVVQLIAERPNICKHLHVPAQSGNSAVLERMRRGYTREAYVELVENIRGIIPNVSLSSDFIAGFCGETDEEFQDTLSLIHEIKYNTAFLFAYSMREKTTAYRRYKDDVPENVKKERLAQMISVFRKEADTLNKAQIGRYQLILVEGTSKRSPDQLQGRTDGNVKVIIPAGDIAVDSGSNEMRPIKVGDYVVVQILEASSQVLKGLPRYHSSIAKYSWAHQM